jgi:glucokinase
MSHDEQSRKHTVGVDVGGTKIYTALIDASNNILSRVKKKTREGTPDLTLENINISVSEAMERAGLAKGDIDGIGIGFPGPLDPWKGIVTESTNLPEWDNFPLAEEVSKIFKCPAFLDNDVNLGTLAEALVGAGKGTANVIGIFLGTGVGGGLVFNRKLYHGTSGTAGEVGHMIIENGGRPSPRGLFGSIEGLTSRTCVVDQVQAAIGKGSKSSLASVLQNGKKIKSAALASAYRKKDRVVVEVLERTADYVGIAIGSLVNLLAPDVVVLGGGLVQAVPEAILPIARNTARKIAVPPAWKHVRVEEAALGDDAGAMGGALLVRQKLSSPAAQEEGGYIQQ